MHVKITLGNGEIGVEHGSFTPDSSNYGISYVALYPLKNQYIVGDQLGGIEPVAYKRQEAIWILLKSPEAADVLIKAIEEAKKLIKETDEPLRA